MVLAGDVEGSVSPASGFVAHSAEGWEAHIMPVLNDPQRRASWHFTNLLDGRLWQHYPIFAQCWASGAGQPNNNWPAMEHEGIAGTPITDAQVATTARVIQEISSARGWTPERAVTLWEHREMARFGAPATACPSDRIRWGDILTILEGSDMTQEQLNELGEQRARAYLIDALLRDFKVVPVAEAPDKLTV